MKGLILFAVTFALLGIAALAVPPAAPRLIIYQGRLTDAAGTPLPDGAKSVRFIIWNHATNSAPANEIWNSGPLTVTTTTGLFSVMLGASPQPVLAPALLTDTSRWLGISVGADPEISPRTRLVSVPYAMNAQNAAFADSALFVSDNYVKLAGDTMTGDLVLDNDALGMDIVLDNTSTGGELELYHDGVSTATLYGSDLYGTLNLKNNIGNTVVNLDGNRGGGGILYLYQQDGTSGTILTGGSTTDGASLSMYNSGSSNTIRLDADLEGTAAVVLPSDAISSGEIWNEPGITADDNTSSVTLNSTVCQDIGTITITTPTAGYIVVRAKVNVSLSGTRSMNYGYVQIDEFSGGSTVTAPYYASFGFDSTLTTGGYMIPVYVHRVFFKSEGTFTFRVEGIAYPSNGTGSVISCMYPMITATYYPTAYGTVGIMSADQSEQFETATAISGDMPAGPANPAGPQTMYRVDLRELELKAAKAQAEAERAQRELAEAKLRQEIEQNRR